LALGALVDHVIDDYANVTCTTPRYIDFNAPNSMEQFETLKRYVLDAGYEGLIVKDPEAGYYCKRHDAWMKIKPFIEVSLTIVDVNEGEKGTKREGFLGALVCEGVDDDKQIRVNVGSGFTDEMLVNFWLNRPKLIGMIAEVRADAISQNADGGYSLRFPRFKCFRGFKKGEKL
jgi:DNA ligase-1